MTSPRPTTFQRCCVAAVAAAMLLQPMAAYSATITNSYLNETALQGLNKVKPNIVFTVDDSGSMRNEYLPDFAAEGPPLQPGSQIHYCRDNRHCGGIVDSFNGTPTPNGPRWDLLTFDPPIRSSNHNKQFYDPAATYLPGRDANGNALPYESASQGPGTAVYKNAYASYLGANPNDPTNLINLLTGYPDTVWCNVNAAKPPSQTDIDTATVAGPEYGSICRLNGRLYPAYTRFLAAAISWQVPSVNPGYNYPNEFSVSSGKPTTCGIATDPSCVFKDPFEVKGNPYYYTITQVEFCKNPDAAGFGMVPCQDRWDQTDFKYIRYGGGPFNAQAFTRVDIKATGFEVNGVPVPNNPNPVGRGPAEEIANFAKWYAFYRDRVNAIKTAAGLAFANLTEAEARVGLHTLHENATLFKNVAKFNTTEKSDWFNKFYAVKPNFGTPLPEAVFRIGEYFANSGASGLPGATDPLDPDNGMCQPNYHLLATDGYWNAPLTSGNVDDRDLKAPASLPPDHPSVKPSKLRTEPGFTLDAQLPRPYYEGPTPTSNSLADLAMYYFVTDLRPSLDNRVEDAVARWQHVTLFGISQGAQGSIPYPSGLIEITGVPGDSTTSPPTPAILPTRDWPPATGAGGPESVDDLWHAALNSHGDFATAQNPQDLAKKINEWISLITAPKGTGTAIGLGGAQITATRNFGYQTLFEGLWGDVLKFTLNPDSGVPVGTAVWSAADQLEALAQGSGWNTNRRIVTINDELNKVVPFRLVKLSDGQKRMLTKGWTKVGAAAPPPQAVLDFLRGSRDNDAILRVRPSRQLLGDIVYSGAVVVGAPSQPYLNSGNPGYENFKTLRRVPMVYVGGNDGMVHAFIDSCPPSSPLNPPCLPPPSPTDPGKEAWAYVPKVLLGETIYSNGDPNDTNHTPDPDFQLGALAYTAFPNFKHKFYVNATARAWDVDLQNTNTPSDKAPKSGNRWRTILVGGLGAGGRSVYALDITEPPLATDNELTVADSGRVLWEFTDPDLGYVFDPPTIVKTDAYGWVVLLNSGYNNPGGKGFLYVLNPENGAILKKLPLIGDSGNDGNPTGLSTIRAYTASRRDPIALQAYGGDLKGNVWRFDLSDPNPANWRGADRIAELKVGNNAQPITTGIRIEIDQNNNVDRYLFIGTGKLLGVNEALGIDDINSTNVVNSLYVIRDGTRLAPEAVPATPYSRSNLNVVDATGKGGFSGTPTGRGWYQDATDLKEKIVTDVFADVQTVVFAFSKPTLDPCAAPLSSRLYARDFTTGASVLVPPTGGGVVDGYDISSGIAGLQLIQGQPGSGGTASGDIRALVTTMKGEVFSFGINPPAGPALRHRVSWRLLNRN